MQILYKESVPSRGLTMILGLCTILVFGMIPYQQAYGGIEGSLIPNWTLITMGIFFVLLTVNFSCLKIVLSDVGVKVNYGILSANLPWSEISDCEIDQKNYFYGWGIRFGRYKGNWIWIYNTMGDSRIVFITDRKSPRGLMVSTQNPQEIIDVAKGQISKR